MFRWPACHQGLISAPDVVLCDLAIPGLSGLDVMKRVTEMGLKTRFVVLSMYHDHAWVQQAIEAGASGYVLKVQVSKM